MNNSDKVRISLHNPGQSSPVVQETQHGSSNGDQTPSYNGNSNQTGSQNIGHNVTQPAFNGSHNGGQPPYNGGQSGGQPAYNGDQTGGSGSGAQKMSAPRRGRGVLQQQEPGMRVPVCGATGEPIRWTV